MSGCQSGEDALPGNQIFHFRYAFLWLPFSPSSPFYDRFILQLPTFYSPKLCWPKSKPASCAESAACCKILQWLSPIYSPVIRLHHVLNSAWSVLSHTLCCGWVLPHNSLWGQRSSAVSPLIWRSLGLDLNCRVSWLNLGRAGSAVTLNQSR